MAVNKVIYDGRTLIDLTEDTVTADTLSEGVTAHNASGELITGTSKPGGGEDYLAQMLTNALTNYSSDKVNSIREYAFYYYASLASLNFPNATNIDGSAFYKCTSLASVNFPKVKSVGTSIFHSCALLTSADFPNLTSINNAMFYQCTSLASVNCPNATNMGSNALYGCTALASVNFPKVASINTGAFSGCTALSSAEFSHPTRVTISGNAFYQCGKLTTLILRSPNVCTLSNTSAFSKTPYASGGTGGTVYVPQALIASYQAATNWSTLYKAGSCNFVAIEGSAYE
jgi:hypothetical protein